MALLLTMLNVLFSFIIEVLLVYFGVTSYPSFEILHVPKVGNGE